MVKKILICAVSLCMLFTGCFNKKTAISIEDIETEQSTEVETTKETEIETTREETKPHIGITSVDEKTGYDIVKFGQYDKEVGYVSDIEWLLVDKNSSSYLLVSKDILDCKNFNEDKIETSFQDSTLKKWLNEDFLNIAFSTEEQKYMDNVSSFQIFEGGKVSLLSLQSLVKYFNAKVDAEENYLLSSKGTIYAVSNYLEVDEDKSSEYYRCGSYYLSDEGSKKDKAMWVGKNGKIYTKGQSVTLEHGDGIRPVISINKELFDDISIKQLHTVEETTEIVETTEETVEETTEETIESSETTDNIQNTNESDETEVESSEEFEPLKTEYDNTTKEQFQSLNVPSKERNVIYIDEWEYGRTPLEWIYVKPNTQIICNNTPNNSVNFSYKKKATSGSKGCFIPIFIESNSFGSDYDGRFYSMYDYTKYEPEDMTWSDTKTFESLIYEGHQVKEILSKKYDLQRVTRNLMKVGDTFINVVYVDELDEIIEKYYK